MTNHRVRIIVAIVVLPLLAAIVVNSWAAASGTADAERAALYATQGDDPTAGIDVRCAQRWQNAAAIIGKAQYHCTFLDCAHPGMREFGDATLSHSIFGGWRYQLSKELDVLPGPRTGATEAGDHYRDTCG